MKRTVILWGLIMALLAGGVATAGERPETDKEALLKLADELQQRLDSRRTQLYYELLRSDDPAQRRLNENPNIELMYIDERGRPVYNSIANINAARTISTDDVWPGGSAGLALDGASTVLGELGVWDGGGVLLSHQEFGGRVSQMDFPGSTSDHATHVAGTMIGAGVQMTSCVGLMASDWSISGSTNLSPGEAIGDRLTALVENIGDMGSMSYNIGIYLSSNDVISIYDTRLTDGLIFMGPLAAGGSEAPVIPSTVAVPSDYIAGPAYLGILVDEGAVNYDCNGSHNFLFIPVNITGSMAAQAEQASFDDSFLALAVDDDRPAKGMSHAGTLAAYDWSSDYIEMLTAAAIDGLLVSNHSYVYITGWYLNGSDWYWYGDPYISPTEDWAYGFYGSVARNWDEVAYNAPYYTICKAAGNERGEVGPGPGGGHYVYDGGWVWSTDTRERDGGDDGYDCIPQRGVAKNVLTVGAVWDVPAGYSQASDVLATSFTSFGPTDDGRIKPDITGNGATLWSASSSGDASYTSKSGTSMACPNVAGSLNLLIQHYEATHSEETPLSATMKALVVETADEAGLADGPDYQHGWGLMNTQRAAELISDDATYPTMIQEELLSDGESLQYTLVSDGVNPIRITMAWTDPPGTPPDDGLNPPDLMLVNDLDMRLEHTASSTIHEPYILDPAYPANPATFGDNFRDNVEQIYLEAPAAGVYQLTVTHKATLDAPQAFSLVSSQPFSSCVYCCCVGRVGDANGEGGDEPTIGDVAILVEALFIAGNETPIACIEEADVNMSAMDPETDNLPVGLGFEDITIGDIAYLIDYLYITGSSLGLPDCL